jgi:hypothetical protein
VVAELAFAVNNGTRDDLNDIEQRWRRGRVANLFLSHGTQFGSPNETPDNGPVRRVLPLDSPLHLLEVVWIDRPLGVEVVWDLRGEGNIQTIKSRVDSKKIFADEVINERRGEKETIQ